jgi:hypothetical protein
MKSIFTISLILITSAQLYSQQNWFDKDLTACIVALEKRVGDSTIFHGTGFLLYNYKSPNEQYLITCAHVLRNPSISIKIPASDKFRGNNKGIKGNHIDWFGDMWYFDGNNFTLNIPLIKDSTFFLNKDLDIGILKIVLPGAIIDEVKKDTTKLTDRKNIPRSQIKTRNQIELGTEIYFLGFPFQIGTVMGVGGKYSNEISAPLLRTGTIAWKTNNSKEFLLDAFSYGGNSGSPIFSKRDVFGGSPYLIGMVVGHLRDPNMPTEVDINIGLARGVWIDDILEIINEIEKK